jgi:hypothetical protein
MISIFSSFLVYNDSKNPLSNYLSTIELMQNSCQSQNTEYTGVYPNCLPAIAANNETIVASFAVIVAMNWLGKVY